MSKIVVALILYKNKYLLIKKPDGRSKGKWAFPNVILPGTQTQEEAIIRKIKTTLGLDISPYKTLDSFSDAYPHHYATLLKCSIHSNPVNVSLVPTYSAYLWTHLLHAATLDLAPLHKDIITFLTNQTALGALTPLNSRRAYDMRPNSTKSRLLKLLQDSLHQNSSTPVSFTSLATQLSVSRQCIRTHYYQLKTLYPVPPVATTRRLTVHTDFTA